MLLVREVKPIRHEDGFVISLLKDEAIYTHKDCNGHPDNRKLARVCGWSNNLLTGNYAFHKQQEEEDDVLIINNTFRVQEASEAVKIRMTRMQLKMHLKGKCKPVRLPDFDPEVENVPHYLVMTAEFAAKILYMQGLTFRHEEEIRNSGLRILVPAGLREEWSNTICFDRFVGFGI